MFDELRRKPKHVRNQYAFWGAVLITGIIAGVWFVSVSFKVTEVSPEAKSEPTPTSQGAFAQFFSEIKDNFNKAVNEIETDDNPPATTTNTHTATTTNETETVIKKPAGAPVLIATSSQKTEAETE